MTPPRGTRPCIRVSLFRQPPLQHLCILFLVPFVAPGLETSLPPPPPPPFPRNHTLHISRPLSQLIQLPLRRLQQPANTLQHLFGFARTIIASFDFFLHCRDCPNDLLYPGDVSVGFHMDLAKLQFSLLKVENVEGGG